MKINYLTKLKKLAENHTLPHAILLSGDQDITIKIAEDFAKWLFCENQYKFNGSVVCKCKACSLFVVNHHPDYCLIDLGTDQEIKIDVIREVNNFANSRPYLANRKVLLINNLHNINKQAANAFLKTLEEPSTLTEMLFLLITNHPKMLPATVLSRVLQINVFADGSKDDDNSNNKVILQDLYNIWVKDLEDPIAVVEKWKNIDKQQLINCLWFIVTNAIKAKKEGMVLEIKQKITINVLWRLWDSLNYMNRAIILGYQINWQLFLDLFVLTKFTGENIYGRSR